MGEPLVNGDAIASSQFLAHLTSYPLINDSFTTVTSHPYARRPLDFADRGCSKFTSNISFYLPQFVTNGSYKYLAPYLERADSLGNEGLNRFDLRFPIVKKDYASIRDTVVGYVSYPLRVADDGKQFLLSKYEKEVKKFRSGSGAGSGSGSEARAGARAGAGGKGKGYVAHGRAFVATGLLLTSESLAWLSDFLGRSASAAAGKNHQEHHDVVENGVDSKEDDEDEDDGAPERKS